MADNTTLDSGTGGDVIATEDISSVKYQKVKLVSGTAASTTMVPAGGGVESAALRVTIANDSTGVLSIDDNADSITVDSANLVTLAGAVAGTEMQVDVVGSLPAGTAAIGKLAANSGVDIGDVDVTSVIPGTGATNLGKAIGTAVGATDTGVAFLAIRDDTLSALSDAESDFVPLRVGSTGALHVTGAGGGTQYITSDVATVAATGTLSVVKRTDTLASLSQADGDWANMHVNANGALWVAPIAGSAEFVDDATFTPGSSTIVMVGATFDDVSPDSITEGDAGAIRMSARRELYVQLRDAAGNERGLNIDASGRIAVTGAAAGTEYNTNSAATTLAAGTLSIVERDDALTSLSQADGEWAHLRVDSTGALWVRESAPTVGGGTEAAAIRVTVATDSTGVLSVDDNGAALTVDNAGTFAVQVDGSALTALQLIDDPVFADDAPFTLTSSKVEVSGAIRDDALSTLAAAETDAVPLRVDSNGALWTRDIGAATTQPVSLLSVPQHTVLGSGTFSVQVTSIAAGDNNIGNVDVLTISAGDNNIGNVDIVSLPASTNTLEVVGDAAHGVTATGNPVLSAGVSQNVISSPAPTNRVSSAGMSTIMAVDRDGALFVRTHPPQIFSYHLDTSSAQTDATVSNAAGAGLCHYIGTVTFSSGAATAINLLISDGNTNTALGPYYLEAVAGRGMAATFNPPRKLSANTSVCITTSASIAHSVDITGFIAP